MKQTRDELVEAALAPLERQRTELDEQVARLLDQRQVIARTIHVIRVHAYGRADVDGGAVTGAIYQRRLGAKDGIEVARAVEWLCRWPGSHGEPTV